MASKTKKKATRERLTPIPRPRSVPRRAPADTSSAPDSPSLGVAPQSLPDYDIRRVPIESVEFDPDNANEHPEENLEALRGSLEQFGQRRPLVVNKRTNRCEAGNGLLQAALSLGWTSIVCWFVDDDEAKAAAYAIADNRTAQLSRFNNDKLLAAMKRVGSLNLGERCDHMMTRLAEARGLIDKLGKNGTNGAHAAEPDEEIDEPAEEDSLDLILKAPYPWFGGKSRVAKMVWKRFGNVRGYIEPFFGSGAVLLNRPQPFDGTETINDFDAMICNFWRAVKADPKAVIEHADWPVNECCPAGTMIATPGGSVPIEDIRPGMIVWGWDGERTVPTVVSAIKKSLASELVQLGSLRLTDNHPVWTAENGYVPAGKLADQSLGYWHVNEYDPCYNMGHEQSSVGDLWTYRSAHVGNSLCRCELSQQGEVSRAHQSCSQGRQNARLLLDSISPENRFGAQLHSIGERQGNRHLAGMREPLDSKAERQWAALQSHEGRRGNSRLCPYFRTSDFVEQAAEGKEISSRSEIGNARQKALDQSSAEDRSSRARAPSIQPHTSGYVASGEMSRYTSRAIGKDGRSKRQDETIEKIPPTGTRGTQHQKSAVRADRANISLCEGSCSRYRGNERSRSIFLARAPAVQRIQFQNPITVYNFQTETGNYFAAGILVHNCDLHARHSWLIGQKERLAAKLEGDPDWFDVKAAGWWCWGMALWIGAGFCAGDGPWKIVEQEDGSRQLVHLGDAGQGVNRQLVHLGNAGRGEPQAGLGECGLLRWMEALSERLRRVRVCCGDWTRICGGRSGDAIQHFFSGGEPCGVFLDPPYKLNLDDGTSNRGTCYNTDSKETDDVADAVCKWAIAHGDDERLRIALCGYAGEYKMPDNWTCVAWKAPGGMAGLAKGESQGKDNCHRERIWFSPHCIGGKA